MLSVRVTLIYIFNSGVLLRLAGRSRWSQFSGQQVQMPPTSGALHGPLRHTDVCNVMIRCNETEWPSYECLKTIIIHTHTETHTQIYIYIYIYKVTFLVFTLYKSLMFFCKGRKQKRHWFLNQSKRGLKAHSINGCCRLRSCCLQQLQLSINS